MQSEHGKSIRIDMNEQNFSPMFDQAEKPENQPFRVYERISSHFSEVMLGKVTKKIPNLPYQVGDEVAVKAAATGVSDFIADDGITMNQDEKERYEEALASEQQNRKILEDTINAIPFLRTIFEEKYNWMFLPAYSYFYKDKQFLVSDLTKGTLDELYGIVGFEDAKKPPELGSHHVKEKLDVITYLAYLMWHFHLEKTPVGDVKLSNTMETMDGRLVYTDFSKQLMEKGVFYIDINPKLISQNYLPMTNLGEMTILSYDIYGFICMLYELLTGFKMLNWRELFKKDPTEADLLELKEKLLDRLYASQHVFILIKSLHEVEVSQLEGGAESLEEFGEGIINKLADFFLTYFNHQNFKKIDAQIHDNLDNLSIESQQVPDELKTEAIMQSFASILNVSLQEGSGEGQDAAWQISWPADPNNQAMAEAMAE